MSTKKTPVRSLAADVSRRLPGFTVKGRMIFQEPIKYLLGGLILDSSAYSKEDFYPTVFVQPLYIESDYIFFTFGGRLPGNWKVTEENRDATLAKLLVEFSAHGLPFLESLREPIDLAKACEPSLVNSLSRTKKLFSWRNNDIHVLEARAYSWCLSEQPKKAVRLLEEIHSDIERGDDKRDWVMELDCRTQSFLELLREDGLEAANEMLEANCRKTAVALKIDDWLAPSRP